MSTIRVGVYCRCDCESGCRLCQGWNEVQVEVIDLPVSWLTWLRYTFTGWVPASIRGRVNPMDGLNFAAIYNEETLREHCGYIDRVRSAE